MAITREQAEMQSLQIFVRNWLNMNGYSGKFVLEDAFDETKREPLETSVIVLDHEESRPYEDREIGGPLTGAKTTFIFDVFGANHTWGFNLATAIGNLLQDGTPIPLYDFSDDAAVISGDQFESVAAAVERVRFAAPAPWQAHRWVVAVTVERHFNSTALA